MKDFGKICVIIFLLLIFKLLISIQLKCDIANDFTRTTSSKLIINHVFSTSVKREGVSPLAKSMKQC